MGCSCHLQTTPRSRKVHRMCTPASIVTFICWLGLVITCFVYDMGSKCPLTSRTGRPARTTTITLCALQEVNSLFSAFIVSAKFPCVNFWCFTCLLVLASWPPCSRAQLVRCGRASPALCISTPHHHPHHPDSLQTLPHRLPDLQTLHISQTFDVSHRA